MTWNTSSHQNQVISTQESSEGNKNLLKFLRDDVIPFVKWQNTHTSTARLAPGTDGVTPRWLCIQVTEQSRNQGSQTFI